MFFVGLYCVAHLIRWGLVNESHGHWIEIVDPTGETTGIVGGSTLYYNRETEETRFKKPSGWVRLRAESIVSRAKKHENRATSGGSGRVVHHASSHAPKQEDVIIGAAHYGDGKGEGGDGGAVATNAAALGADPEWSSHFDEETSRWYYVHNVTGETQWAVS